MPSTPLLLDPAGGGVGKGRHALKRGASRIGRTLVLLEPVNDNYKREAIDAERWRARSGWAVGGGRMAVVSEFTNPPLSSAGTVSIGRPLGSEMA